MNLFSNNKGLSAPLLLLIAGVLIVGTFFLLKKIGEPSQQVVSETKMVETEKVEKEKSFETFEEPKNTPTTINNTAVEELDAIVSSIEDETDDLTDIEY